MLQQQHQPPPPLQQQPQQQQRLPPLQLSGQVWTARICVLARRTTGRCLMTAAPPPSASATSGRATRRRSAMRGSCSALPSRPVWTTARQMMLTVVRLQLHQLQPPQQLQQLQLPQPPPLLQPQLPSQQHL